MVNSVLKPAENVGYAIKYKQIKEFLTKNDFNLQNQSENIYKDLSFVDKVMALQNRIYLIEIVDTTKIERKKPERYRR